MTTYDLAVKRQKTVASMDQTLDRMARQVKEARMFQSEIRSAILDGKATLPEAVLEYEAKIIRFALRQSDGQIKKAAGILGVSWQTLGEMLKNRHKALMPERNPIIPRRSPKPRKES